MAAETNQGGHGLDLPTPRDVVACQPCPPSSKNKPNSDSVSVIILCHLKITTMAKYVSAMTISVLLVVVFLISSAVELAGTKESLYNVNNRGFIACMSCMTGASPGPTPSKRCCIALSRADLPCLCKYKDSPVLSQMGIRPDLAKQVSTKCKLSILTECN
ncbi:hypothetical protein Cni_G19816 [Canna indica]|uniref:Bifunctional inhibitor/plant lipid transfer protein/seed storage helical domain-containing protein n=1 Tax=Canna indica TaxID=4628 RepID=A0AAQ3QK47_9LILI|nr:hypothetical protein Cni_G19816 [Canna indica]